MFMANKRGPKRTVKASIRVGEWGGTGWQLELECGHVVPSDRRAVVGETRVCCKICATPDTPQRLVEVLSDWENGWEPWDPTAEIKMKAKLASLVGVPLDQVEINNGTATIFVDAQQVRSLTGFNL